MEADVGGEVEEVGSGSLEAMEVEGNCSRCWRRSWMWTCTWIQRKLIPEPRRLWILWIRWRHHQCVESGPGEVSEVGGGHDVRQGNAGRGYGTNGGGGAIAAVLRSVEANCECVARVGGVQPRRWSRWKQLVEWVESGAAQLPE